MSSLEHEPTLAQLAIRANFPDTWQNPERAEYSYEISDRLCGVLGLSRYTDEIRAVSKEEADRQGEIFDAWRSTVQEKEEQEAYHGRMGDIAMQLVDALVPESDPRDREVLVDSVLAVLKPIDDRLVRAEQDGVVH